MAVVVTGSSGFIGSHLCDALLARGEAVVGIDRVVYGGSRHGGFERASRESDPLRPRGGHARSKVAMEQVCLWRAAHGGRVAVARPFTVAGEGQRPDMAIATWIESIRAGKTVTLLGSPGRTRDVADVRDVVRGLIAMADREVSGVVNLGSGSTHSLTDTVRAVSEALSLPALVEVVPARTEEVPSTRADTTRCEELLGVTFTTDLKALVMRQLEAT
ncbi:MAG: NAD-dependent epimerase/dehydratase family protein, partial [Actinomycetota bacterium]